MQQPVGDEGLDAKPYPHSFDLRPSGPNGMTIIVVGAETATIRDARRFVVAFKSSIAVILAVHARHIRIDMAHHLDSPD